MGATLKGWYHVKHPEKYVGDVTRVRYMSSWEKDFHAFLDNNPNVLRWSSEEIKIPYIKPTDGRIHYYYPDYWMEYKNRNGEIIQEIIEVKPLDQTIKPKLQGKSKKTQLHESIRYEINKAKWAACQQFCDKYGIRFRIITERNQYK